MVPNVQKLVSDAYSIMLVQLDHNMVFGTKSGAVQDFQRDKKCPIGVKQTPFDPPRPPQNTPKLPRNPPKPNY